MTDEEFIRDENLFKDALKHFINVCEAFGVEPSERIADALFDEDISVDTEGA